MNSHFYLNIQEHCGRLYDASIQVQKQLNSFSKQTHYQNSKPLQRKLNIE